MWFEGEVEVEVGHKKKKHGNKKKRKTKGAKEKMREKGKQNKQKTNSKVGKIKNRSGVRREDREMRVKGGPGRWEEGWRHLPCR